MAVQWGQRKALGRRYSYDPAMAYEIERLRAEYALAPTRAAQGMEAKQIENQSTQFGQSLAQSESQFSRTLAENQRQAKEAEAYKDKSMEQQESQFTRGLDQSNAQWLANYELSKGNAEEQKRQFGLTTDAQKDQFTKQIDLSKEQFDKNYKLAQDNLEYAKSRATTQDEQWKATMDFNREVQAANVKLQQDAANAAKSSGITGTIGNFLLTGAMLRATTKEAGTPFFGETINNAAGKLWNGVTGGGSPVTPTVSPAYTDASILGGGGAAPPASGSGAVAPMNASSVYDMSGPASMYPTTPTGVPAYAPADPAGMYGSGMNVSMVDPAVPSYGAGLDMYDPMVTGTSYGVNMGNIAPMQTLDAYDPMISGASTGMGAGASGSVAIPLIGPIIAGALASKDYGRQYATGGKNEMGGLGGYLANVSQTPVNSVLTPGQLFVDAGWIKPDTAFGKFVGLPGQIETGFWKALSKLF